MARTRNLEVVISGDTRQLNRAFGQAEQSASKLQTRMVAVGRGMAVAGTAAAGALALGLTKSTQAAVEAEKSQARLVTQLRASGINYRAHAKEIDNVIQRTAKLAAVDDEDLQDAFTNIVRATGNVSKSLRLTGLAADLAAAKHIDLQRAGDIVGKVASGNTGVLSRYGITIQKGATATQALGILQRRFAGQAEAYGKTTAGSMDRARNSLENLGEVVGAKTAPLLATAANAFTGLITGTNSAGRAVRTFATRVSSAFESARAAVSRFVTRNRADINAVIDALQTLGRFFRSVFNNVILAAVRAALPGVQQALNGIVTVVRGLVRIVSGILTGDWRRVWNGLKDVVIGAVRGLAGVVRAAASGLGTALINIGKGLGRAIVQGVVAAFTGIGGAIKDKLSGAIGALNPFGEGLGKKIGDGAGLPSIPNLTGVGPGNLMGAQPALSPFASIGSRFGLHVSSGRRPGSITSSGNVSYHSTGEAIDEAGSPGGMMGFFRYMKSNFGSRLAELIYTPGGAGIKDGRPFTYTGQVAADHYDHVHVALDTGRPGVGDGIGDATRLARQAGFRGQGLITALAVAGAESGWRAGASNRNTNGSIDRGYWQINSIHGALSTFDPLGNARAAYRISSGGRDWSPWVTYQTGAYRRFLGQARAAAGSVGTSGASRPGASSGSRGTGSAPHPAAAAAPTPVSPYEMATALSDAQIAQAEGTASTADDLKAKITRRSIVAARINKVKAALKKRNLRPQTRLRLTQELASLRGEHNQLQTDIGGLRHPASADASADGTTSDGDPNQALIDSNAALQAAIEAHAQAEREHTDAVNAAKDELKRQTDFAATATATSSAQAWRALADILSGQIGGYGGLGGRALTAGAGTVVRY